jgi:hypothetical protein
MEDRGAWIGFDLSGQDRPRRMRNLLPLLMLTLITALGIAALRIDLIRVRYAVAAATERENALIEEQRELLAHRRQLRDPGALAVQAHRRGFRPAARTFSLPDPGPTIGSRPAATAGPREGAPQ